MTEEKPIIDAATVLIVRDTSKGMEVFMVVRHHEIDFASGALVFPGGKVDPADRDDALIAHCADSQGLDARARAFRIGAIREAFEECGVLFARRKEAGGFLSVADMQSLEGWRARLNNGEVSMLDFARAENLEFTLDCLAHYAHWITPDLMPKRFDTHFFLARAPEGHFAEHDGGENIDSIWIRPAQALDDVRKKQRTMVFPTRMNVQRLATFDEVDGAISACGDVVTVEPFLKQDEDGTTYLRIQAHAGYGDPKEPIGRAKG